jgi:hypothetical protein
MPDPKLTDKEARALYLLSCSHFGWSDDGITIVEPERLRDAYSPLEYEEINRRLPALKRKGFAKTPVGYEEGKAFQLLPTLDAAWKSWMNAGGFNKIEEFKQG